MADQGKRVIVDGVDFQQVFLFPRILGAMTAAMQPGRLVIALLMVVTLITAGRLWDAATQPNMHPGGLTRYEWTNQAEHERALAAAIMSFASHRALPGDPVRDWGTLKTREVMSWVQDGYLEQRGRADDDQERAMIDEQYRIITERVELTRPRGDFEGTMEHAGRSFQMMLDGVFALSVANTLAGAEMLFVQTPKALWQYQRWFAILYGLVFVVVFAIGGGALSRMAAVQQAREQRLSVREATDFALSRAGGLVWAQILPVVIMGILAGVIMVLGLLMRVPLIDVIAALGYGLILLMGFLIAFLLIGFAAGFPMLVPAVACENCDGADAMQRTYAYVVNRPLHILWYWGVALLGLGLGFLLVSLIATITLNASASLFGDLASSRAMDIAGGFGVRSVEHPAMHAHIGNWHERWAGNIIDFWQTVVVCLVVAYVFSYHFSASTIVYLLMRKASDGQEMDEIWRPGLIPGTLAPVPPPVGKTEVSPEP